MRVLGDDRFHFLQRTYQKAKGKSVCMKPWCKRKSAVFTIEISLDDLITKLVQNIPKTSVDLSQSFEVVALIAM